MRKMFESFESDGTVFGAINKTDLHNLPKIIPDKEIVNKFEEMAKPLDAQIYNNELEIISLKQTRDTLLPKLLSGQITPS